MRFAKVCTFKASDTFLSMEKLEKQRDYSIDVDGVVMNQSLSSWEPAAISVPPDPAAYSWRATGYSGNNKACV